MRLLLRIEGLVEQLDVRVEVDPEHTIADLVTAIASLAPIPAGLALERRGGARSDRLAATATVASAGLVNGDILSFERPASTPQTSTGGGGLRFVVVSGLDTGLELPLEAGRVYTVGRSSEASLPLTDPTVSRSDFSIRVGADMEVTLDPGRHRADPTATANALFVGGSPVISALTLPFDVTVTVGATSLVLRTARVAAHREVETFGSVAFHRTPYRPKSLKPIAIERMADLPKSPMPRRFNVITTVAPLLTGIAMAAMIGNPRFLLFAAMSPVIAIANWWDARRMGGKQFEQAVIDFGSRLGEHEGQLAAAADEERRAREERSPSTVDLVELCEATAPGLWGRGPDSDDLLLVRLGRGTTDSLIDAQPERDGDQAFRDQVAEVRAQFQQLHDVPVTADLVKHPVIAVHGSRDEIDRLASSIVFQIAALHSPEDVVLAAAMSPDSGLGEWMKWLPHVRSTNSPIEGNHLAIGTTATEHLIDEIAKIASRRSLSRDRGVDLTWPHVAVLVDADADPEPSTMARICESAREAGVVIIWTTTDPRRIPRRATLVLDLEDQSTGKVSKLRDMTATADVYELDAERVGSDLLLRGALALSPLRDASATKTASAVPQLVTLFDSLEVSEPTPEWVIEQWTQDRGYALPARIGFADRGPVEIDLVAHGPHGLIGGTSGAGKSELVQSLVASLLASNSPERVNVLFVDYKGGALSSLFDDLPHCVGAVTNLDALLSLRALTSLKAELDRRMALFEAHDGVKDLRDMLAKFPDSAPPSLVIVVDEFAALVRELPEFVDGIVSIAERGRSLGIHLLLSTQRPSGSINENIQQNTNLRISLRMLDSGESNNVIGTPDAALIPAHLKGRGFARLGPGQLLAFQSAWSGAPARDEHRGLGPVLIDSFRVSSWGGVHGGAPADGADESKDQLFVLRECIRQASATAKPRPARPPWQPALTGPLDIEHVLDLAETPAVPGTVITAGMLDDPANQTQYPLSFDLDDGGGLAIFGGGGSGKTTALRTIAAAAAIHDRAAAGATPPLSIMALDFGSQQLIPIRELPQTALFAGTTDMEGTTRLIAVLHDELEQRRLQIATALERGAPRPDHGVILLLIDGYDQLIDVLSSGQIIRMQTWIDRLQTIIQQGRTVRIYPVIATAELSRASGRLMNTMSNRLVLRQTDENAYRAFGVPAAVVSGGFSLEPGQALHSTGNLAQVAMVADESQNPEQAYAAFAASLGGPKRAVGAGALPENHLIEPETERGVAALGVRDLDHRVVTVDMRIHPFVVSGPRRSGRSTVLRLLTEQLRAQGYDPWTFGPGDSALRTDPEERAYFGKPATVLAGLEAMRDHVVQFPDLTNRAVVFDDLDRFADTGFNKVLGEILASEPLLLGSCVALRALATSNPMAKELKASSQAFALAADDDAIVGRYHTRPGVDFPAGRGVLTAEGRHTIVQAASELRPAATLPDHDECGECDELAPPSGPPLPLG